MQDMIDNGITLTKHAVSRMRERLGVPKKSCERLAKKAYYEGTCHAELRGKLKKYIDGKYMFGLNNIIYRVYGEYVYLFDGKKLVTVINLNNKFKKYIN